MFSKALSSREFLIQIGSSESHRELLSSYCYRSIGDTDFHGSLKLRLQGDVVSGKLKMFACGQISKTW